MPAVNFLTLAATYNNQMKNVLCQASEVFSLPFLVLSIKWKQCYVQHRKCDICIQEIETLASNLHSTTLPPVHQNEITVCDILDPVHELYIVLYVFLHSQLRLWCKQRGKLE